MITKRFANSAVNARMLELDDGGVVHSKHLTGDKLGRDLEHIKLLTGKFKLIELTIRTLEFLIGGAVLILILTNQVPIVGHVDAVLQVIISG